VVLASAVRRPWRRSRPWPTPDSGIDWRATRFCVVDIETTGLDPACNEIVSVGVAEVVQGRITQRTFYRVVQPSGQITEDAMRCHSLTSKELADAPAFNLVKGPLTSFLEGAFLVAHAAWFERAFLDRMLKEYGERLPDNLVDTAALARRLELAPATSDREPSLEALSLRLGLPVHTPHHALGDAMTTAQLLLAFAARLEAGRKRLTVSDLLGHSRRQPPAGTLR
jgi:DNA polymerase III subunit epsilon